MVKYLPNTKDFTLSMDSSFYFKDNRVAFLSPLYQMTFRIELSVGIAMNAGVLVKKLEAHGGHLYAFTDVETLRFAGDYAFLNQNTLMVRFWPSHEAYKETA
jgi:hypothetical protein